MFRAGDGAGGGLWLADAQGEKGQGGEGQGVTGEKPLVGSGRPDGQGRRGGDTADRPAASATVRWKACRAGHPGGVELGADARGRVAETGHSQEHEREPVGDPVAEGRACDADDTGGRGERAVRITVAELEPADAVRLASGFAVVLGESEATYGG